MSVKRSNRSAALRILHEKGAMSRKRLAENMHLTPAAITKIVGEKARCSAAATPAGGRS